MGQAQSKWHKDVGELTRKHGTGTSSSLGNDVLHAKLQQKTNVYLRRKRQILSGGDIDAYLGVLVKAHHDKHVALVACAHVLSRDAIRDLLQNELQVLLKDQSDVSRYMQTILAIARANPRAVGQEEVQCANALLHLCTPDISSIGRYILTLTTTLAAGAQGNVIFSPIVNSVPTAACQVLVQELEVLKTACDWSWAHAVSEWLAGVPAIYPTTENFLNSSFPDWQIWALWRPDTSRLVLWKQLDPEEQKQLRNILALEGPDFLLKINSTLREALVPVHHPPDGHFVSHKTFSVKLGNGTPSEAHTKVNQVLEILDRACSSCPSTIPLLIHIASQGGFDEENLRILTGVNNSKDPAVAASVFPLLGSPGNANQLSIIKNLLQTLELVSYQGLRDALAPRIVAVVEAAIVRLQWKLSSQLESGQAIDGVTRTLSSLANLLQGSPWLAPFLSDNFQSIMGHWPAKEDVDALLQLRLDAHGFGARVKSTLMESIDQFISARLVWRGFIEEAAQHHVYLLIRFWQETTDTDLRSAALAIAECSEISADIRGPFLENLPKMTQSFVNHVIILVKKESDMACINMVESLASRQIDDDTRACWRELLQWAIDRHEDTILNFSLMHFGVNSWFKFLEKIRILFRSRLRMSKLENDIFNQVLHAWADHLSAKYVMVLTELERKMGSRAAMKWILTGWDEQETILPLLGFLKSSAAADFQSIIQSLLVQTSPDGSNGVMILKTISLLSRATKNGLDICGRMVNLWNQGAGQIVQGMLACWLQIELSQTDIHVLQDVAKILDSETNESRGPSNPVQDLQAASEFLDGVYDDLIQEALRLESIRRALKSHDAQATSTLLLSLGMEDPSALENAMAHVLDELIDVIEKLGPGQFELSFPLTDWKPLRRTGSGVGTAQAIILRLYLDGDESTTCQKACSFMLRKSSLEVRLADLRHDPMVVTLLFAAIHAVAGLPNTILDQGLLPGYPLSNAVTLGVMEEFPAPTTLQSVPDLTASVRAMGTDVELLMSWMCTTYRGFLTLATGALKVPSMPGVYQYVLASASPEKEAAFKAHPGSSSSEVVFHGTSFDRLYSILRDGLRVLSTGPLRKHGASYGAGIYVADDPRTAWSYATQREHRAGSGWLMNELINTRVLLGCEMVRPAGTAAAAGIHVVTDESHLMVRYIFICPAVTTLPIAAHIVPAMKSTFHSLRTGSA
ncbi:hypothetical protein IFR05_007551 [Cadophora sp. M221]|nr:hypothetical protein IFR05_007551 [Cadophora sp. M221]